MPQVINPSSWSTWHVSSFSLSYLHFSKIYNHKLFILHINNTNVSCRGFSEDSRALCIGVCYSLLGYIFTDFISLYNTIMKLIFLGSSFFIVWYIRRHKIVRRSYDKDQDTFRHYFLVLPCLLLALIIHEKFTFKEVCIWHMLCFFMSILITTVYMLNYICLIVTFLVENVDIFFILRSCCNTSSIGFDSKNKKYR